MGVELQNGLNIRIKKFFSKPRAKLDAHGKETGEMTTEDWVEYAPPGQMDRSTTREKIASIKKIKRPEAEHHPAAETQFAFKEFILRHYDMWKAGEEAPLEGTPLAAWNVLESEDIDALKRAGIRTVEEIAQMNDSIMTKVAIARPREKKVLAQRFLDAADQNRTSAELKRKDEEMAAMKEQIAELTRLVTAPPKKTLSIPKTEAAA